MGNTSKQCRLGLFQDSDFAGDLEDSKSTSGGILCIFGSHTFVPISWICKKQGKLESDIHKRHEPHKKIDVMKDIDAVPSNVQSARQEALLYVFEDKPAVLKMIIKGRSPTMRHVSRTRRVALHWLFDRINLDPKIQIKYIDTKNQLADILTKGMSRVTSGITCCACSILAISVLQFALLQWRSDLNKFEEKGESQQNREQ